MIEEDGDEIFTPIPERCHCGGKVAPRDGFHKCDRCGGSYGPSIETSERRVSFEDFQKWRNPLRWYWSDGGIRTHEDCGGEVYTFKEGFACSKCSAGSESEQ